MTEAEYALSKLAASRRQVEDLATEAERTKRIALERKRAWEHAVRAHFALERMLEGDDLPLFEHDASEAPAAPGNVTVKR